MRYSFLRREGADGPQKTEDAVVHRQGAFGAEQREMHTRPGADRVRGGGAHT
ncbi:MAG: hypothetical protein ACJ8AG_11460 [Ktedonobacteraceae bacterium]